MGIGIQGQGAIRVGPDLGQKWPENRNRFNENKGLPPRFPATFVPNSGQSAQNLSFHHHHRTGPCREASDLNLRRRPNCVLE